VSSKFIPAVAYASGILRKPNPFAPCFSTVDATNQGILVMAGTAFLFANRPIVFNTATVIPINTGALAAGTDYAIYVTSSGLLIFSANFTAPYGYTAANSFRVGGFHFAPGGPASTAQTGGNTTPQIFPPSIWDLQFRPACPDPRAKAFCPGAGWVCLYPLNTNPDLLGASAYGAQIADGSSLPIIPAARGGNGSAAYPDFSRFVAEELLGVYGLELLTPAQRAHAAYGVTEGTQAGADPVTTGLDAPRTSCFMFQATGNMWEWLAGDTTDALTTAYAWQTTPQTRGQVYHTALRAPLGGGYWFFGADCGSRCSYWGVSPWYSYGSFGARGRCDHLQLV